MRSFSTEYADICRGSENLSMPGDGTGVDISNWTINKYNWNETGKVHGVCTIKECALPQTFWNLEWRNVVAFGKVFDVVAFTSEFHNSCSCVHGVGCKFTSNSDLHHL